jgi:two-component system response regulator YesN
MSRILLVDDEPFLLEALHMLLRRHRPEWSLRVAPGSAEALDALAAEPADVVVSDLGMPGMDGAALLEHVLLSGLSAAEMLERGAIAHVLLQKPCDTAKLCAAIEQTLAA